MCYGFFRERSTPLMSNWVRVKPLISNYTAFPRGELRKLCDSVYRLLSDSVEQQAKQFSDSETVNPHDVFAAERARVFKRTSRGTEKHCQLPDWR